MLWEGTPSADPSVARVDSLDMPELALAQKVGMADTRMAVLNEAAPTSVREVWAAWQGSGSCLLGCSKYQGLAADALQDAAEAQEAPSGLRRREHSVLKSHPDDGEDSVALRGKGHMYAGTSVAHSDRT